MPQHLTRWAMLRVHVPGPAGHQVQWVRQAAAVQRGRQQGGTAAGAHRGPHRAHRPLHIRTGAALEPQHSPHPAGHATQLGRPTERFLYRSFLRLTITVNMFICAAQASLLQSFFPITYCWSSLFACLSFCSMTFIVETIFWLWFSSFVILLKFHKF